MVHTGPRRGHGHRPDVGWLLDDRARRRSLTVFLTNVGPGPVGILRAGMSATAHPASAVRSRHTIVLGVVGGSGLYEMDALDGAESVKLTTPFGDPSGALYGRSPAARRHTRR